MPNIGEFLLGSNTKTKKLSNMSEGQEDYFNQMLGGIGGASNNALSLLQAYLDPNSDIYKNFEAPYMQQFYQQDIPMLAERFAGLGGGMGGALSSSGFGQALGAGASNLRSSLAGLKSQMQRQSIGDILGFGQNLLGLQPFSYMQQQGSEGLVPGMLKGLAKGIGSGLTGGFGGMMG